jgi:uncharacterized membrane protein YhaH (DUF805 family)
MSYPPPGSGPYPSPEQAGWYAPPPPAYQPTAQMGLHEAVASALGKYATFAGRARRSEYWWFYLAVVLVYTVAAIVDTVGGVPIMTPIVFLAALIPSLAVSVRRLHDVGQSGWWLLLGVVPLVGAIVLLVFACQDSQPGPNRWGPSPKYP